MISELLNSYALTLADVRAAAEGLSAEEMVRQFPGVPNHPAWTIGHLVYSAQSLGGEVGLAPWLPSAWDALFGTGSVPEPVPGAYPPPHELLGALDDAQARLTRALSSRSAAELEVLLPDVRYRASFPTVGHAVLHILSGHTSFHLGQLSLWRRVAGGSYPGAS